MNLIHNGAKFKNRVSKKANYFGSEPDRTYPFKSEVKPAAQTHGSHLPGWAILPSFTVVFLQVVTNLYFWPSLAEVIFMSPATAEFTTINAFFYRVEYAHLVQVQGFRGLGWIESVPVWLFSSGNAFPTREHQLQYPTAISFSPINLAVWAQMFAAIFKRFQWTSLSFIYDRSVHNSFYTSLVDSLKLLLAPPAYPDFHIMSIPLDTSKPLLDNIRISALKRARNVSRSMWVNRINRSSNTCPKKVSSLCGPGVLVLPF